MSSPESNDPSSPPAPSPDSDVRPRQTLPGGTSSPPSVPPTLHMTGSTPPPQPDGAAVSSTLPHGGVTGAREPGRSSVPPTLYMSGSSPGGSSPGAQDSPERAAIPPAPGPAARSSVPPTHFMSGASSGTTAPGAATAPAPSNPAPPAEPRLAEPNLASGSAELALDSADFERVTLVDLPTLATYGKYELLGRIAFGGMAEIFLARERGHESTTRMMVVKRVLPHVAEDRHFVDMFRDEARLAMQLNHPNVCHVYAFGEVEGTHYLAMEWINGQPLSKIIRRARAQGGIPVPFALKIFSMVAEALDYAHRACDAKGEPLGIVHRDVSPQNIMVSYDGVVKLLDFGIAKATSHSTRTEAGIIKGKFAYMSPQQCVGELIDSRADIFALGICMFEALAGKNPFKRKTEFETMTKIVGDPTPDLQERRAEVTDEVVAIVEKALMKQPELRYQSAGEMQLAIETALPRTGQLVNSSRLGEYVTSLFPEVARDGPTLDTRLSESPRGRTGTGTTSTEESIEEEAPKPPIGATDVNPPVTAAMADEVVGAKKKRSGCGVIAIALGAVLLLGLGSAGALAAWFVFGDASTDLLAELRGDGRPVEPAAQVDVAPTPTPGPTTPTPPTPTPPTPSGPAATTQAPAGVEAPSTGSVYLESVPPGADIEFGSMGHAGSTPLELGMVAPGTYDVRLTLDGHQDWTGQVTVTAGGRETVTAELARRRAAPETGPPGQLSLNTRPWSKVYLGRRLLGTTPLGRVSVPSGNLRLRLVDRDGNEHQRRINVPPGGNVTQSFDLR